MSGLTFGHELCRNLLIVELMSDIVLETIAVLNSPS